MIISNVQNVKELRWVFLPEHFLACRQTFVVDLHKNGGFNCYKVALRTENTPTVHEKHACWSRKACGRYSQCSFSIKLSVHEKAVVRSRWSLFAVVAHGRFYCIVLLFFFILLFFSIDFFCFRRWDFGDGLSATGMAVTHMYTK